MDGANLKEYYDIYTDGWRLFRRYYESGALDARDDVLWEQIVADAHDLHEKHGRASFALEIANATISELERLAKEGRA